MDREKLAENILTLVPMMFKRLSKGFPTFGISKQQVELLFTISKHDGMNMSFYSEHMMISKPNLTVTVDKLIEEGLIAREADPKDRRIVSLKMTEKGRDFIQEHKLQVRGSVTQRLSAMSDEDVKRANELITELKNIFDKMDGNQKD